MFKLFVTLFLLFFIFIIFLFQERLYSVFEDAKEARDNKNKDLSEVRQGSIAVGSLRVRAPFLLA